MSTYEQTHPRKLGTFVPTGMLRFVAGRLQQHGEVFTYFPNGRSPCGFEWRDVPSYHDQSAADAADPTPNPNRSE